MILVTATLLFQTFAWAKAPKCSQIFIFSDAASEVSTNLNSSDSSETTFSEGHFSFRLKTFLQWRQMRGQFRATVKSSEKTKEAYKAFFELVNNHDGLLTENRFLKILEDLPELGSQPKLKNMFFEQMLALSKSNKFSSLEKFMDIFLTKISSEDLLNDPQSATIRFLMSLAENQSSEIHPYILAIMHIADRLILSEVKHDVTIKKLNEFKNSSRDFKITEDDLNTMTQYLWNTAEYYPNSEFEKSDVIELMTGQWGSKSQKSPKTMTDEMAEAAMQKVVTDSKYTQDRALFGENSYQFGFIGGFKSAIKGLSSDQVWLDSGAGRFKAISQYFREIGEAKVIGVSVETPRDSSIIRYLSKNYPKRFKALLGSPIESYSNEELGPVDLITDYYGAFSYSPHPDIILRKYLDILKVGGRLDIFIWENASFVYVHGVPFKLIDWIGTIPGITFETENPRSGGRALSIKKVSADVGVPTLNLYNYEMNLPARRGYFMP
jgi:hypothetical protein